MAFPKVGDIATESRTITEEDVKEFAKFSGDYNPLHMDDEFAAKTRFKKRIAHGLIPASMLSKLAASKLPGPGSIYLSHNIRFRAPAYIGDTVTAEIKILNVRPDKPIISLSTICRNQDGKTLIEGEALVYFEPVEV